MDSSDGRISSLDVTEREDCSRWPVLVIPGYGAPEFQTNRIGRLLRAGGLDVVRIKLPWMAMGDMPRSAGIVAEQVTRLRENLGCEKVNFFGYSLGGVIALYYLQEMEGHRTLSRGAFVSSPNAGTGLGYLGFFSPAGRQVRTASPLIRRLNESPARGHLAGKCLSIFVRWDGVIIPHESSYIPFGYNLMHPRPILHWRAITSSELVENASIFLRGGIPEGAVPGAELFVPEAGELTSVPWAAERRRLGRALWSPFRSIGSRVVSLFKRRRRRDRR